MKIVHANTADLPGILALQYLAYQSEAKLLNDPEIPPLKQTLAEAVDDDGTVIGSVRGYSQDGTFYIGKLIVRPDLQGQGIGTALMTEVETLAASERYELFTSSKSVRNIKLYERLGYKRFKTASPRDGLEFVYLEKILPS